MAKRSTPNSIPANGRTSTLSLARSRKQKAEDLSGKQESRKANTKDPQTACEPRSNRGPENHPAFSSLSCFPAFLRDFSSSRRVKGAWWPSRSSKSPLVFTDRGRFDSYPLRSKDLSGKQQSRGFTFAWFAVWPCRVRGWSVLSNLAPSCFPAFLRNPLSDRKEVIRMSREQIRKLTSLSSCAG
jgi:hypothetical protein